MATVEFLYHNEQYSFVSRDDDPLIKDQAKKGTFYELSALERQASVVARLSPTPSDWVVDAGANIGNNSVFYAKRLGVGKVLSFEMNEETFGFFKANIRNNNCSDLIVPYNVGLSDRGGRAGIRAPSSNPLGGAQLDFDSSSKGVVVERLDNLISGHAVVGRCVLFKIDVEGHELEVLRGARSLLTRPSPPPVYLEIKEVTQWRDICRFLDEMDYAVVYAEDDALPNFLFAHRSMIQAIFAPRELETFRADLCGRVVDAWQLHRKIRTLQHEVVTLTKTASAQ